MDESVSKDIQRELHSVLDVVDHLLDRKDDNPSEIAGEFSQAVRSLAAARNQLADAHGKGISTAGMPPLPQINALLSLAASIQFPLAGIHWPRLQQIRDQVQGMVTAPTLH